MSSTLSLILRDIPSTDYVFCDLDGTLVDSERFRISTYYESLDDLGFTYRTVPLSQLIGNSSLSNLKAISPGLSDEHVDEVLQYRNKKLSCIPSGSIQLMPGVYSTLLKYFPNIVLVTNSSEDYACSVAHHFKLRIASIVSCESFLGLKPKPSPSLYEYAFAKFLSPPCPSIVLEDSKAGLQAASLAGSNYIVSISLNGQASLFSRSF